SIKRFRDLNGSIDKFSDLSEIRLLQTSGRHSRRSKSKSSWLHSTHITRHCVLVGGDINQLKHPLNASSINFIWLEVNKHKMVLGLARDDSVAKLLQFRRERRRVRDDLELVFSEARGLS